eukprot:173878-Alexandrium_andersonii.AAC.1
MSGRRGVLPSLAQAKNTAAWLWRHETVSSGRTGVISATNATSASPARAATSGRRSVSCRHCAALGPPGHEPAPTR